MTSAYAIKAQHKILNYELCSVYPDDKFFDTIRSDFFKLGYFLCDDDNIWNVYLWRTNENICEVVLLVRMDNDRNPEKIHLKAEGYFVDVNDKTSYVGAFKFKKMDSFDHFAFACRFDFKKYHTDDEFEFIIKCEVRPTHAVSKVFSSGTDYNKLMPKLQLKEFFNSKKFSDLKLTSSDNQVFFAHRCVLIGASSVFEQLIEAMPEITLEITLDGATLRDLLHFIYSEELEILSVNQALKLLEVAYKFELPNFKYYCVKYLDENYQLDNVLKVLQMADFYNEEILSRNCIQYVKMFYDELSSHEDWTLISANLLEIIKKSLAESPIKIQELKIY